MKSIFSSVIKRGCFDLTNMLSMIDRYHIEGKLSDVERDELYAEARSNADTEASIDYNSKVVELDCRMSKLEKKLDELLENGNGVTENEEYPEYIVGRWYYEGAKVTHDGKRYICIAPNGVVCTWSPSEYPSYWTDAIA